MPNTKKKSVASVDVLLQLQLPNGNMVDIGGQQGATLNRETVMKDITVKTDDGRTEFLIISDRWDVNCNGFLKLNDDSMNLLHEAVFNRQFLHVKIQISDGFVLEGRALVTSFPLEIPVKDNVKYSLFIQGSGELKKANVFTIRDRIVTDK